MFGVAQPDFSVGYMARRQKVLHTPALELGLGDMWTTGKHL